MRKLWLMWLAGAGLSYGQLDSNTVTVTASRTATLQPDQVTIGLWAYSKPDTNLDDVIAALPGLGLSAANLSSVFTGLNQELQWSFTMTVPFSKIKDTLTALNELSSIQRNGMSISYYLQGTKVSPELQAAHPCPQTTLLADAQVQAQKVAAAVGMSVGAVVSMSDGSGASAPAAAFYAISNPFTAVAISGVQAVRFLSLTNSNPQPACSLIVQFRLK